MIPIPPRKRCRSCGEMAIAYHPYAGFVCLIHQQWAQAEYRKTEQKEPVIDYEI